MSVSRLVALQQIRKNWLKHEDRLIHIKSTLNTRAPHCKMPSARKPNINKSLEIQLENKALLKKLTDRSHLREDMSVCHSANPLPRSTRRRYYEEHRIKCENEGMYRRLKETKPMIDLSAMRVQRAETEKLLNTISKFGYKNLKPTKTLLKFDMRNNELKYLSRRKILIEEKLKQAEGEGQGQRQDEQRIIEQQLARQRRNEKLFQHLSRVRQMQLDGQQTLIKITRGSCAMSIQLRRSNQKENQQGELQVSISWELFKEKYHSSLEELLGRIKYDCSTGNFYIL